MKKVYNGIKKYLQAYFKWIVKNQGKGFLSVVGIVLIIVLINLIITPKIHSNDVDFELDAFAQPIIEEIELTTNLGLPIGEIEVYKNGSLTMYFDTKTANVRLYDEDTDTSWNSTFNSSRDFDKLEPYEIDAMSPMNITYFGYDNSSEKWNVFENSVTHNAFSANKIANGIQLVFDVQDLSSVNLFEYIPEKISKERYESMFIDAIENSDLSLQDKNGVQTSIDFCYLFNAEENNYYYRLNDTPQLAMIEYLILGMETIGYTKEDVVSDNQTYGIVTVFDEKPHFEVTMEFTLDEDDLIVNVPTGSIKNYSDKFDIINIEVLPNFGGADYRYTDGYTLLPDGSGAIMELDSYSSTYPKYSKPVYDNNLYFDIYNEQEYSENIEMPIFGMTYKKGGATPIQGYFSIIEQGAELSYINSQVSDGYTMNQSFSSFDTIQSSYSKIFGPYAIQNSVFRSETEFHNINYQVRYKLLLEEESTYYEMANIYKDYLLEKYEIDTKQSTTKLHLDVLGSVTVKNRILGIPYDHINTYTSFSELNSILNDIDNDVSVNYLGVLNDGVKNDLLNKVEVVNGMKKDMSYEELLSKHDNIYTDIFLTRSYSNDNGMKDAYAIHDFYGEPVSVTQYNQATNQFEQAIVTAPYQVVSPRYLEDLADKYLKESDDIFSNVGISDLGSIYYVDYNRNNYVSAVEANMLTHQVLQKINSKQNIIMTNPFVEFVPYNDFVTDIAHESSNYGGFTYNIPFKQLVYNGMIPFTTENMNHNTSHRNDYYLLQYAELGAIPKFFVSYNNTIDLKVTEYNYYYSIQYDTYKEDIQNALDYIDAFDSAITDKEIIGHDIVGENIYKTTYKNGEQVYVNYNDFDVTVTLEDNSEYIITPYSYYID